MTEIVECGRTIAGGFVAFDVQWDGALPDDRPVLWTMFVTSVDGQETVQLGYQRAASSTAVQFVDDDATGRRVEVDPDADLGENEITVRFPAEVVGVAVEWPVWRAVLVVDGQPVSERVAG